MFHVDDVAVLRQKVARLDAGAGAPTTSQLSVEQGDGWYFVIDPSVVIRFVLELSVVIPKEGWQSDVGHAELGNLVSDIRGEIVVQLKPMAAEQKVSAFIMSRFKGNAAGNAQDN